jgi:hypothetical protein
LKYKYNEPFGEEEANSLKIFDNECRMKGIVIMKCSGKHETWKRIM